MKRMHMSKGSPGKGKRGRRCRQPGVAGLVHDEDRGLVPKPMREGPHLPPLPAPLRHLHHGLVLDRAQKASPGAALHAFGDPGRIGWSRKKEARGGRGLTHTQVAGRGVL